MRAFANLSIWQKSHELALRIYTVTIILSKGLSYIAVNVFNELNIMVTGVRKMIHAYRSRLD